MGTAPPTHLSVELQVYEANKSKWLKSNRDEFVVIKGEDVLGFFSDFHAAYSAAVEKYGINTDVLVKRVVQQEPVFVVF